MTRTPETDIASGTVVVTGASGFVGTRLVTRLREAGHEVVALSRATGFDVTKDDLPLEGASFIYHAAARTYVPDAWDDPEGFYRVNALGTVRVLEQARRHAVPICYLSAYVYGTPKRLPISETQEPVPNNPYAFSKFMGEEACRFYNRSFGLPTRIFRIFNLYGEGQPETFLIPTILGQALDVSVDRIAVADLAPRRDYVHVDDAVAALVLAPTLPLGGTYNIGSGHSLSVEDVIRAVLIAAGKEKPYSGDARRRPGEIMDVIADISAIARDGGWTPRIPFEEGLRSLVAAHQP